MKTPKKLIPNRIVKYLILSDIFFWMGWGLLSPVFSIFVVRQIQNANAFTAGMGISIFLIARSLIRTPSGIILDTLVSEKDDYFVLVVGMFITSLIPLAFVFASKPIHLYFLQAIKGLSLGVVLSAWNAIFTRHIDSGKEATQWGLDSTALGLSAGISGIVGGWLVTKYGFDVVFVLVSVLGIVGSGILLSLREEIKGVFDNGFHVDLRKIFKNDQQENS